MNAIVADDSGFIRGVLSDILEKDGIKVVAEAKNGRDAVEKVQEHQPDVVTMDVEMPEMDGIEAVGEIIDKEPTPVVMFSAHTEEGSEKTFEALDKGAVDFIPKPSGDSPGISAISDEITETVRASAEATPEAKNGAVEVVPEDFGELDAEGVVVIVGASTGGPAVVESVVGDLDPESGIRVVVVQHMPELFTERFAERLDENTDFDFSIGSGGGRFGPGEGMVAPGNGHLIFTGHSDRRTKFEIDTEKEVNNVKPSITETLKSAARFVEDDAYAVILTGMGSDGERGADRLKRKGGTVIAQEEESCAIYGIPQAVVEGGYADTVAPPDEIPGELFDHIKEGS